ALRIRADAPLRRSSCGRPSRLALLQRQENAREDCCWNQVRGRICDTTAKRNRFPAVQIALGFGCPYMLPNFQPLTRETCHVRPASLLGLRTLRSFWSEPTVIGEQDHNPRVLSRISGGCTAVHRRLL